MRPDRHDIHCTITLKKVRGESKERGGGGGGHELPVHLAAMLNIKFNWDVNTDFK